MGLEEIVLRLRRVRIKSFRSLAGDVELSCGRGAVFVLGRNGSGKTTLLELLANLISCRLAPFLEEDEPVDIEWELEWEGGEGEAAVSTVGVLQLHLTVELGASLDVLEGGGPGGAPVRASLGHERPAPRWVLEGVLTPPKRGSGLVLKDNQWVLEKWPEDKPLPPLHFRFAWNRKAEFDPPLESSASESDSRPLGSVLGLPSPFDVSFLWKWGVYLAVNKRPMEGYFQIHFAYGNALQRLAGHLPEPLDRFDEALGVFDAIVDAAIGQALAAAMFFDQRVGQMLVRFVPKDLLLYFSRFSPTANDMQPALWDTNLADVRLTVDRKDIPSNSSDPFHQIVEILGADQLEVRPRLLEQEPNGNVVWRGFDFYVRWPGGVKHRHTQLSFGQKRVLAFLWYAAVFSKAPLLTDELTNGFHDAWARQLTELLADRQVFHAIQNPLLLDKSGPGSVEEIPGRFILCSAELGESGRRQWRWRNPTEGEATRLRQAWEAGFQQLSEVLLSEGLW